MWYDNENGSLDRPDELDTTSSKAYVYIRKDFVEVPEKVVEEDIIPAHYRWKETKISKEDWEIYAKVLDHDGALDDVYEALTELAEMITEG